MALYLGKIGRRILNYTVTHPRLNRAVNVFGRIAHKATRGIYTPGLTRETFLLYQRTLPGDIIDAKLDGFYRNEERIAGNIYIYEQIIINGVSDRFQRTADDTPEIMAKYYRTNFGSALYLKSFKSTTIAIILFSLVDIISRVAVNAKIPEKGIEYIGNYHSDIVGEYTRDFLTNYHHHAPSISGIRNIAVGLAALFLTSISYSIFKSEKLLRNLVIVSGSMGAAGALVNGAEILINGYATDYLGLTERLVTNIADLFGLMGGVGAGILSIAVIYKEIKNS